MNDQVLPTDKPDDVEIQAIDSEEEDAGSSPGEYKIASYPADFTLEGLDKKVRDGELRIPKFQRQFVWSLPQASKLIESFLAGLPVPPIFLFLVQSDQTFLVVDGQQRLKTIQYFFEGYFGPELPDAKRTVFRLKGLDAKSRWADKRFSDLSAEDQRKLRNSVLRSLIVQQLDPKDDTSIYHIFERLNTGGTLLKNQEVRNCVFWGKFIDLLTELNRDSNWRMVLGKKVSDSRQKDIELILRFFAVFDELDTYEKPMKDFLNNYMARHRNPAPDWLEAHGNLFRSTCRRIVEGLGPRPFHVWAGLNSAVFDSVTVAFASVPDGKLEGVKARYSKLTQDPAFVQLVRAHTTDEDVIRRRVGTARERLFVP
jgi:hypothetical protein